MDGPDVHRPEAHEPDDRVPVHAGARGPLREGTSATGQLRTPYQRPGAAEMMSPPHTSHVIRDPLRLGRADRRRKEFTVLLLISPDGVEEALDCAKAAEHLDIVDVKKPDEGSLGANFPWVIREIRDAVPADKPVSATVGDVPYKPGTVAQAALGAVVSGATYIKVGLYGCTTPGQGIEVMRAVVRAVKDHRPEALVVASGYADAHRIGCVNPLALPDIAARSGADAAMLDTAVKDGTRLFDHVPPDLCAEFVRRAHASGLLAALAGSVERSDLGALTRIGTDIVGVRGAVCEGGDRDAGRIQPHLVAAFRAEMDRQAREQAAGVPAAN